MPSAFVRARSRNHRLLHTAKRGAVTSAPSTLVVVGMGTAGVRRSMLFAQRMSELSAAGRIQTVVGYDCNEVTIANVQKTLQKSFGAARTGAGTQVLFPNYVPMPNGFMRDPKRFRDFLGPLERDMDNIISQVMMHSERCGRVPETIIEFMGFSGHAVLGGILHQKLRNAFPNSAILPVMMLPKDHVSEEWTKRYIWEQYEELLSGSNCLVTTQSDVNAREDDVRLATGLAGFEVAEFGEENDPSVSQLGVTLRRLTPASGGWLGMAAVKRKMPITKKFEWLNFPPWWRQYAAVGPDDDLSSLLGNAIWSTLDPAAQLAEGINQPPHAPQEIVVSLPLHGDELEPVAAQAAEALDHSNIFDRFTNLDIAFNTARFTDGIEPEPYMHVTRIYPVNGELQTVTAILRGGGVTLPHAAAMRSETGFGSYFHLRDPAYNPLLPPGGDNTEIEDNGQQHVRYV
ncbi:hypothetical protein GBAR_LOCUS2371 [Geodia barretti]|jgi:hypothetical protein|uniref:Uncharacterized protein n=1 Tax=Geodia barretti TaxID=519541 RepID=A0AA35R0A2_GEOBA|nr:hypothetical protein GBAR_LOCUS2371 [Geodia barretti]